ETFIAVLTYNLMILALLLPLFSTEQPMTNEIAQWPISMVNEDLKTPLLGKPGEVLREPQRTPRLRVEAVPQHGRGARYLLAVGAAGAAGFLRRQM
ncbi:MAG: hypothetical protein L6R28_23775, partial [Planctomycetes bacterium]|nr:hypothetical protein [Planctomycetota bacterium]